jgi:hypothetical protein
MFPMAFPTLMGFKPMTDGDMISPPATKVNFLLTWSFDMLILRPSDLLNILGFLLGFWASLIQSSQCNDFR